MHAMIWLVKASSNFQTSKWTFYCLLPINCHEWRAIKCDKGLCVLKSHCLDSVYSHFRYLYFVRIILSSKIMPRTRWSRWGWIAINRCCGTVLSMETNVASLNASNWNWNRSIEPNRLTQFRIIKWLFGIKS